MATAHMPEPKIEMASAAIRTRYSRWMNGRKDLGAGISPSLSPGRRPARSPPNQHQAGRLWAMSGACQPRTLPKRSWWNIAGQERAGFLAGGAGVLDAVGDVGEFGGDVAAFFAHGGGPEAAGAVGGADQGAGHDAEEADFFGFVLEV